MHMGPRENPPDRQAGGPAEKHSGDRGELAGSRREAPSVPDVLTGILVFFQGSPGLPAPEAERSRVLVLFKGGLPAPARPGGRARMAQAPHPR